MFCQRCSQIDVVLQIGMHHQTLRIAADHLSSVLLVWKRTVLVITVLRYKVTSLGLDVTGRHGRTAWVV